MKKRKNKHTDNSARIWSPGRPDLSSRKRGILSINADHVLAQAKIGYQLTHAGKPIAEVVDKRPHQVEIQDLHNKRWLINLHQLQDIELSAFIEDLAEAITAYHQSTPETASAREPLEDTSLVDQPDDGEQTIDDDAQHSRRHSDQAAVIPTQPLLARYFQEEFIPKMLNQMDFDQVRYGDTWLMDYKDGVEAHIRSRFKDYFKLFDEFGKPISWLRVAGYAILAQARLDHPDWLING